MKETRRWLKIRLLDRVVLSRDAATAGGHRGFAYIPGRVLLGAFAGLAYPAWQAAPDGPDCLWRAFHAGALRFGDALPARLVKDTATPTWPVPRGFHAHPSHHDLHNFALDVRQEDDWEAVGDGFAVENGMVAAPRRVRTQRTAISEETGRAATGQLFDYESLERDQVFVAPVAAEEGAEDLLDAVLRFGLDKVVRIGRSRGSEFGRCSVTELAQPAELPRLVRADWQISLDDVVLCWALSDLALVDEAGQPSLRPRPGDFGLPDGARFLPERSFAVAGSIWPWNGALRGRMPERAVLLAGSLLAFSLPEGTPRPGPAHLRVGRHLEQGFGLVARDAELAWQSALPAPPARSIDPARGTDSADPYLTWLARRERGDEGVPEHVARLLRQLSRLYKAAAKERPGELVPGPGTSQWGIVRRAAEKNDKAGLKAKLFDGDDPPCGRWDPDWGEARTIVTHDGEMTTFSRWLETAVEQAAPADIIMLAREARRMVERREWAQW